MSAEVGQGLVMVGVSGGVDSAVAALLLHRQGLRIAGLFMKNWEEADDGGCRAEDDRKDALKVCAALNIPFHHANFAREYWAGVFEHFLAEYAAGRTPNPDILCNREIKFRSFLDHAKALGADKIATGHYARVAERDGLWRLLRGRDERKDQSYFLHALGQEALASTLFPVGELEKSEVRAVAERAGLGVHDKKDSTGICFIGERDFREFLAGYLPVKPGPIVDTRGRGLAEHSGVFFYTLGQREGLNIGGIRGSDGTPWYVVDKDVASNTLIVDQGHDSPFLHSTELNASAATWTSGVALNSELRCTAKTRYRQTDVHCIVRPLNEDGALQVQFDQPQRAVTPGQSVVFYLDDECLGGAVIDSTNAPIAQWRHAA
ncbi:tRNA 2-thiouridine(34) synthase MnmA [Pseudomarimonas arenosa]|uniref:tRNA-specific 2-thiouridylase MnmA n=1 Tax=Pseudomarimonas arenosa TaxID=2774145 RepID=A0AAW3ZKX3_9GAMM|nr:tRNA 2-thiouridine(34) synthase MnmA [Pseudomarimonas arenosa]MBD8526681.1 tRNA 2-thiouridine(34) synthase MnmA [Pseudomarimonas arenosa]